MIELRGERNDQPQSGVIGLDIRDNCELVPDEAMLPFTRCFCYVSWR
jgi:hypothetical protein